MTVFYFTNLVFPNSGMASGNRVMHFARCLARGGAKVVVLSPFADSGKAECVEREGIVFYSFCRGMKGGLWGQLRSCLVFPLRAYFLMRRIKDSETVLYSYTGNLIHEVWACWFSRWLNVPICREGCEFPYTIISHAPKFMQWIETRYLMKFFVGIIAITEVLEEYYRRVTTAGCDVLRIPMTVDCDRFSSSARGNSPFDFEYIAYTGSLNRKGGGVDILVQSFARIALEYPELHLVLLGSSGMADRNRILSFVDSELMSRIHFCGMVPSTDIPRYVMNAKVLAMLPLLTKQQEGGFSTKLGEYLSSGVPTIVTQIGAQARWLEDRKNIFFSHPGDPEDTARALRQVLCDYAQSLRIAAAGREFARSHFHYEIFGEKILAWYKGILRRHVELRS